jgi:carboxypeptidase-like protein
MKFEFGRTTACLVTALSVSTAGAQGRVIHGVIVESAGSPVPYANVIAMSSQRRIVAGADGQFRLPLDSSAKRELDFRRIGYHSLTITLDSWPDSAIRVVMAAAARTLSAVTVAVERSQSLAIRGFYERMADVEHGINHGFFITPEEIESRKGARLTDFLQGHPAVRVKWLKREVRLPETPELVGNRRVSTAAR